MARINKDTNELAGKMHVIKSQGQPDKQIKSEGKLNKAQVKHVRFIKRGGKRTKTGSTR